MRRRWPIATPSIRAEIVMAVVGLTALPFLGTTILFFPRINELVDERVARYSEALVSQVETAINSVVDQSTIISQQMTFWAITQDLLLPGVEEPQNLLPAVIGTQQFVSNLTLVFPFLEGVYVITEDGRIFTGTFSTRTSSLLSKSWIREALEAGEGVWIIPPHVPDYGEPSIGGSRGAVFSYLRAVTAFTDRRRHGVIQVDFRVGYIDDLLRAVDLGDRGHLFVVHENGFVASATHDAPLASVLPATLSVATIPTGTTRASGATVMRRPIRGTDWYLVAVVASTALDGELGRLARTSRIALLLIGMAAVAIGLVVASRITRPLARLVASITRFGAGHLNERLPPFATRDLHAVSRQFNTMAEQVEQLMERVMQEGLRKDQAEIRALQAQINPHFLYNTLEVIRGIALANGVSEAGDVAKSLAKMFRYSIDRKRDQTSIGDELANSDNYVTILRHRYGERFAYVVDVDDEVRRTPCPRLILQPIVENAFVHGIEPAQRPGRVAVDGWIDAERAYVRVVDNGCGIDTSVLGELQNRIRAGSGHNIEPSYGPGIGIANVDRRLKFAYGDGYGVSIDSRNGGGTTVVVSLPRFGGESSKR